MCMGYDSSPIDRPTLHCSIVPGVDFGIWGAGCRVRNLGLRFWSLVFRVQEGQGLRVSGFEFWFWV